ncbi:MAG TPA: YopX family protein [Chitinophagales bacterium]|nr:YopX family protein [Chitinophagales bacterium]HNG25909.1 YopX family protein [Chitinophagales bacterium]
MKFKAYSYLSDKMYVVKEINIPLIEDYLWVYDPDCEEDNYYIKEFFEILQYTTMKDCNEVDIYEGDIIQHDDSDIGGTNDICEVIWCNNLELNNCPGWGLQVYENGKPKRFKRFGPGKCKILGNIYLESDKELLLK